MGLMKACKVKTLYSLLPTLSFGSLCCFVCLLWNAIWSFKENKKTLYREPYVIHL
jgi:hypothetical protein